MEFKRHGKFHHLMISISLMNLAPHLQNRLITWLGCHSAEESSWPFHPGFRAFYNYILGSEWRGGRNDQHAAFLSNWISGLRISANKNMHSKQSDIELQVVCFCFQCFPFASPDDCFQVSDSFDVFKACKDGEEFEKNARFWWFDLLILMVLLVDGVVDGEILWKDYWGDKLKDMIKGSPLRWWLHEGKDCTSGIARVEQSKLFLQHRLQHTNLRAHKFVSEILQNVKRWHGTSTTSWRHFLATKTQQVVSLVIALADWSCARTVEIQQTPARCAGWIFWRSICQKLKSFGKKYWSWWVFLCALKCHFLRAIFRTL